MRAAVHDRYGPPEVLRLEDVPAPAPGPGELLVRVHRRASTAPTGGSAPATRSSSAPSRVSAGRAPAILGNEFAGVVEAIGEGVTRFAVGDRVFGVDQRTFGTNAELMVTREKAPIATMPEGMTFDEGAAMCDGFILAHTCLTGARLQTGQRILIYGATGSIGSSAVQLAHAMGCACHGRRRHLDPRARALAGRRRGHRPNAAGLHPQRHAVRHRVRRCGQALFANAAGRWSRAGPTSRRTSAASGTSPPLALLTAITGRLGTRRTLLPIPIYRQAHVEELRGLWQEGRFRALIDRHYPLDEIVEATRFVGSGRKVGTSSSTSRCEARDDARAAPLFAGSPRRVDRRREGSRWLSLPSRAEQAHGSMRMVSRIAF